MREHVHTDKCESLTDHEVQVRTFLVGQARHPQRGTHVAFSMELDDGKKVTAIVSPDQAFSISRQAYTFAKRAARENRSVQRG